MTDLPKEFKYKRPPRLHQEKVLLQTWDKSEHALLMQQRVGKTKVVFDTANALYLIGKIRNLLVVAPMGISNDWINAYASLDLTVPWTGFAWRSSKAGGKEYQRRQAEFLRATDKLRVFTMNDEAVAVAACQVALRAILRAGPTLLVFDESDEYASNYAPRAKRLKLLTQLKRACAYRRVLTGTPASEGPLDLYGQLLLIQERPLGFETWWAYRNTYATFEQTYAAGATHTFKRLTGYQNLPDLQKRLAAVSVRVLRSDCADLPPAQRVVRTFALSPEHRAVYDRMRDALRTGMDEPSPLPLAARILTGLLRLQQIASGYLPHKLDLQVCGDCGGLGDIDLDVCERCQGAGTVEADNSHVPLEQRHVLPGRNMRFETLLHELQKEPAYLSPLGGNTNKVVVWCRFHYDVDYIMRHLPPEWRAVQFDGRLSLEAKQESKRAFTEDPRCRLLVGHPRAGGRGNDFKAANLGVYYSNEASLRAREQSEDRLISLDKTAQVGYLDLVAEDTTDHLMVKAHRDKRDLAALVTARPDPGYWFKPEGER